MTSKFLKAVFAVLVLSLVVPISPSVSSAKAKLCCKKNCKSMMAALPHVATNTGDKSGSAQCNNESCLITDKNSESLSVVVEHDTPLINFSLVVSLEKESPKGFQFAPAKDAGAKQRSLPLYLSNSILRI
ncbi:MAG: hypothetical protein ACI9UO_002861 [Nitrospinales bacterium]|jgi:hypothetical protein